MVTYSDLGVRPIINALGTVTSIGGSIMGDEVLQAMVEAGKSFVSIRELQEAAGAYISRRLGVDSAFICAGSASGMAIAAAACIAGTNPQLRARLPDTEGIKNEIIMLKAMRFRFDQAFRISGAKIVEVGWPDSVAPWEFEEAFSQKTVAVAYVVETARPGLMALDDLMRISHAQGIPVIVDAAAEIPPRENITHFFTRGADLTIFSGGKDICGPQSTGLIIGRNKLIEACRFNSSPNFAIGRGMKVGKEEIMGFITALDLWLAQDFSREMEEWEEQVTTIIRCFSSTPGIFAKRVYPGELGIQPIWIPRVQIEWIPQITKQSPNEIKMLLLDGEPRVAVGSNEKGIVINPQMLRFDQDRIVAECIKSVILGGDDHLNE